MIGKTLTADDLLAEVNLLQKALDDLKAKILSSLPAKYGSDAWWEKSKKESLEDYKAGRYIKFENKKDIDKFFSQPK